MHNTVGCSTSHSADCSLNVWSGLSQAFQSEAFPARELFDALGKWPVGIAICDRRLRFVAVNRKLADINKIPLDDHPGRSVCDVVGNLASTVESRLSKVFTSAKPLYNAQLVGRLGINPEEGHWIENYFPIVDGRSQVIQVGVFLLSLNGLGLQEHLPSTIPDLTIHPKSLTALPQNHNRRSLLSPREIEVLRLLATGKTTKETAADLGLSPKTVEAYRVRLMLKTRSSSLVDLVHYAIRHEVVELQ